MAEQPIALRDYSHSKFRERYQEFIDEHRGKIERELQKAYDDYTFNLKQDVSSSNYACAIAFPLFLFFGIAVACAFPRENVVMRAIISVAMLVFPLLASIVTSKLRDKIVNILFFKYERKRVLADFVRREEKYALNELMYNDSLPSIFLCDQYSRIKDFFESCLREIVSESFTYSYQT